MKKRIIIVGAGAVGAELMMYIDNINRANSSEELLEVIGFLDDSETNFNINSVKYAFNKPYLGEIAKYKIQDNEYLVLGIANVNSRKIILEKLNKFLDRFLNIIHPSSQVSTSAEIGIGNVIYPHCIIGPNVKIGGFNLITSYSFISHDCRIGNNNFLSTAGLAGNAILGDNNFLGIRSTVLPSVTIGSNNVIQAGMTVDKTVADYETVFYRFKEKISIIVK